MILKYIVELFVKTAQPVGSQYLIEQYNLNYSSATIRNDMMELENMGFLEKTHTSSGRVPSAKGYRYYIDNLRDDDLNDDNLWDFVCDLNEKDEFEIKQEEEEKEKQLQKEKEKEAAFTGIKHLINKRKNKKKK